MDVLVAGADLSVGERIGGDPARIAVARVPARSVLPGMVRSLDEVGDRLLAVPIGAGEPITLATLGGGGVAPRPLAVGERAISVPIGAAGSAAAILAPTVRVDVVAPIGRGESAIAGVVVRAAEVIAVTTPPGADTGVLEGGAVLLRTTEADALRLSAALDLAGGVRLLPRPAGETGVTP